MTMVPMFVGQNDLGWAGHKKLLVSSNDCGPDAAFWNGASYAAYTVCSNSLAGAVTPAATAGDRNLPFIKADSFIPQP